MRTDLQNWTVSDDATVRQAIKIIDAAVLGIVLVVNAENRLAGTITDGDVRRAILAGVGLDEPCSSLMNADPIRVQVSDGEELAFEKMQHHVIRHIPVVRERTLVGMYLLSEFVDEVSSVLPAVVMAGGLGSRLGDLTEHTPEPLIEVGGKPILEHIVEHLRGAGVTDVFITTRYLADQIEGHFGEGADWDVNIKYIREKERLGTAGSLKYLDGEIDRPFLVMNGDLVTDFSIRDMFAFHQEHQAAMTIAVRHYAMKVPFGVVDVEGVHIRKISEKPSFDFFVNAGIYIVEPSLLEHIEPGRMFDITELMERAIESGETVVSFPIFEKWMDVGRPEDLSRADRMMTDDHRSEPDQ